MLNSLVETTEQYPDHGSIRGLTGDGGPVIIHKRRQANRLIRASFITFGMVVMKLCMETQWYSFQLAILFF